MADTSRKKTLDELKNEAIAELERRGYEARGKTPAQIRQMLRERRPKRKSTKLDIGGGPYRRRVAPRPSAAPTSAPSLDIGEHRVRGLSRQHRLNSDKAVLFPGH